MKTKHRKYCSICKVGKGQSCKGFEKPLCLACLCKKAKNKELKPLEKVNEDSIKNIMVCRCGRIFHCNVKEKYCPDCKGKKMKTKTLRSILKKEGKLKRRKKLDLKKAIENLRRIK